ncbi:MULTISPECIES: L7Ae/L30e/S12e/Gadd45 family ribosomal protein [Anaerotignum]|uniref:L7Ae/L30e/S12e/Gadd45 family ribosomal protein n=1 Tax=Anaerotignum TaxID=2039240 RepID=UPI00210C4D07|nr:MULTISPECIES: ribosomal L7Ae/L30e/S12e/Gadd45 family protein [Anaerotignum]MCQ4936958.1 ribosomal L7Ae/L30e/S12e/Gadd45 family protein [Anaerotignum propionicum]
MSKFYSLLGLCKKAGKVVGGEVAVENAIRQKTTELLILAGDASGNTKKKFNNSAAYYEISLIEMGDKVSLGSAIGDEFRAILGVTDKGFAKKLMELAEEEKGRE